MKASDKMKQDYKNYVKYRKNYDKNETLTSNVEMIRTEGTRLICGPIPREIRKELMEGVKKGQIGHIRKGKEAWAKEVFFHTDNWYGAIDKLEIEKSYVEKCVNFAVVKGDIYKSNVIVLTD